MSTKLLHLDSSILGEHSVSRALSGAIVKRLQQSNPGLEITYRDLAAGPIPHLSGTYLAAAQSQAGSPDPDLQADLALGRAVLAEFLAADIVVLGLGFYNFSIPSQVKAWIDRVAVVGQTFRYTAKGPEGLAGGKRLILAIARGGFYGPDSPSHAFEHAESYLRGVFTFLGITDIEVVAAEGIAVSPAVRESGIAQAQEKIAALAA
jgi:FMN-dependent NADH-azoreductase